MPSLVADTMLKFYHLPYLVGYVSYGYPCSRTCFCLLVKKIKREVTAYKELLLQIMEGNSPFPDVSRSRIPLLESQLSHK